MATKRELEEENRRLRTEVQEHEETEIKQLEEIGRLTASGKEKDLDILRKVDMIASRQERITILETRLREKHERLNNSWDKKQAEEIIGTLLEKLVSSGVINSE